MSKSIPEIDRYDNGTVRFRAANLDGKMHGPRAGASVKARRPSR